MKTTKLFTAIALFILWQDARGQGFINLNFENPIQPLTPVNFEVPTTNAMPGWTAYINGSQVNNVIYNTRPLDAAEVTLQGTNSDSLTPIQGNFTVALFGASIYAPQQSAAIGQTGQIPLTAQSLIFWGFAGQNDVSFAGHILSLVELSNTANYNIYGVNISAFAGQTGQLLFTAFPQEGDVIDNIQFSSLPVPEPSEFALTALGALFLGFRRWRNSSR